MKKTLACGGCRRFQECYPYVKSIENTEDTLKEAGVLDDETKLRCQGVGEKVFGRRCNLVFVPAQIDTSNTDSDTLARVETPLNWLDVVGHSLTDYIEANRALPPVSQDLPKNI